MDWITKFYFHVDLYVHYLHFSLSTLDHRFSYLYKYDRFEYLHVSLSLSHSLSLSLLTV